MGKHLGTDYRISFGIILLLVLCNWIFGILQWAYAENNMTTGAIRTLANNSQEDSWITNDVNGKVGRPFFIHLDLSPYPPPAGTFYSALVDVLESPEESTPEIVPGVPDISVRCLKPGIYRLRIRVNLIEKSSCALTNARALKEKEIQLVITP